MIPILIVEDEFLVRLGLKSLIDWKSYGFYIVADASNGEEGLKLYEKYHPYLIITDIRMSPVSGLEMMKEIRSKDSEVKFIIISAYSDFEYAQQAIQYGVELYLNKSTFKNEDLAQILPKISASYKRTHQSTATPSTPSFLDFDITFSDITNISAINKQLSQYQLESGSRVFFISRCDHSKRQASSQQVYYTVLQNLMEHAHIPFQFFLRKDFIICLCKTSDLEELKKIATEAHHTLMNYTMVPYYFGLSSFFTENNRLFRALSEACLACNEFIFDKTVIFHNYSPQNAQLHFGSLNLDTAIGELMSSVFSSNPEETIYILEKIIFSCTNYRSLEKAIFSILANFIEYDNTQTLSSLLEYHLKKDDLSKIIISLKNWIYELPFNTLPVNDATNEYVDKVISYIKNNTDANLSIQNLAAIIHLSPNYLGKIFYQKTGYFINQYITNFRINKSCDLLLHTNLPVNVIGTMVGISNPHYFSKLFHDIIGISPSKYRLTAPNK